MRLKKEIKNDGMKLRGAMVQIGKFQGLGYELIIGSSTVKLCGIGRDIIGLELDEGEEITIKSLTLELES
jgi:hypothetical protein